MSAPDVRPRALGSLAAVLGLLVANCGALTVPGQVPSSAAGGGTQALAMANFALTQLDRVPSLADPTLLLPPAPPPQPSSGGATPDLPADPFPPLTVQRPKVRVDGIEPARQHVLEDALDVPGVSFATELVIGSVAVRDGDGAVATVSVAAVDPAGFRVLSPQVTADAPAVWERLTEGDVAVGHQVGERLGLEVGAVASAGGGAELRIGAYAANGLPPVADALVTGPTAGRLQLQGVRALLVAVEQDANPRDVAGELQRRVGGAAAVLQPPVAPGVGATGRLPGGATDLGITPHNVWDWLAQCESSGRWNLDTGNGYFGGLQFHPDSWYFVGGTGSVHLASREEQIARAEILLSYQGWGAWPACSKWLGLR